MAYASIYFVHKFKLYFDVLENARSAKHEIGRAGRKMAERKNMPPM